MARDATARLYDVDADSIKLDKQAGTITFQAKKGKLADLARLHESIWATRLGDRTGMQLHRLEVTAVGEVVVAENDVILKVAGTDSKFLLGGDAAVKRIREAVQRGEKVVSVTGEVEGWKGNFTQFLGKLPPQPRRILVKDFQTGK